MSKLDLTALFNKLERTNDRLERLAQYKMLKLEDYLASEDTQIIVERLLELVIQSVLDINRNILKQSAHISNEVSNFDSFLEMGKAGYVPIELAEKIAPSGSFRNVLAHEYDNIVAEKVFVGLQFALQQYPDYIEALQIYLVLLDSSIQ